MNNETTNVGHFVPKAYFSNNKNENILLEKEKTMLLLIRSTKTEQIYKTFYDYLQTYLHKIQSSFLTKIVSNAVNHDAIFLATTISKRNEGIFSTYGYENDYVTSIMLESNFLNIDWETGETDNIDECFYSIYFTLIRFAARINKNKIIKNYDLQKLLSTYFYQIILKSIGKNNIFTKKQKELMRLACLYLFCRYYLFMKHPMVISKIKREFHSMFDKTYFDENVKEISLITKYSDIKDIGKVLVDLNVFNENPNILTVSMIRLLGTTGFFNFISGLDRLIAMVIIAKYSSNLFNNNIQTNESLHNSVETIFKPLLYKIKYKRSKIFFP